MKTSNTVWRLLRRNISAGQLVGYALANFVGLAIVLTAMQLYRDINSARSTEDSFITRDYLVLSKQVQGLNLSGDADYTFTADERSELQAQPWAERVGEFTAADYNVAASVDFGGQHLSTYLFLESIPDDFFDIAPDGWADYDPHNPSAIVPVVLSKDYLALYNFGFAASRGMPQVSEAVISSVPLRLSLSGNGVQRYVPARIVGFSSRLNTIAVPQKFLDATNAEFGESTVAPDPSRLIVEVNAPGDPAIRQYLDDHGYETAGDKNDNSRATRFLTILTAVVIAVGVLISALAFFVLLLSIYLLLQKNKEKIHDLILLGYTPRAVATHYYIIVAAVNGIVLLLSLGAMIAGSAMWGGQLRALGLEGASLWPTIAVGVAVMAGVTIQNFVAIYRRVSRS